MRNTEPDSRINSLLELLIPKCRTAARKTAITAAEYEAVRSEMTEKYLFFKEL